MVGKVCPYYAHNGRLFFLVCCASIGLFGEARCQISSGTTPCISIVGANQGRGSALLLPHLLAQVWVRRNVLSTSCQQRPMHLFLFCSYFFQLSSFHLVLFSISLAGSSNVEIEMTMQQVVPSQQWDSVAHGISIIPTYHTFLGVGNRARVVWGWRKRTTQACTYFLGLEVL